MMHTVYSLADPRDGSVRYIGYTGVGLDARLKAHVDERRKKPTRKKNWIASLRRAGVRPVIAALEVFADRDEALEAEMFWIATLRYVGLNLTNATDGGTGGVPDAATRAKQRAAKLGGTLTAEHKAKIGAASRAAGRRPPQRQGRHSEETIAKMREAARRPTHLVPAGWNKGKKMPPQSAETIAKRTASLRQAWAEGRRRPRAAR